MTSTTPTIGQRFTLLIGCRSDIDYVDQRGATAIAAASRPGAVAAPISINRRGDLAIAELMALTWSISAAFTMIYTVQ